MVAIIHFLVKIDFQIKIRTVFLNKNTVVNVKIAIDIVPVADVFVNKYFLAVRVQREKYETEYGKVKGEFISFHSILIGRK